MILSESLENRFANGVFLDPRQRWTCGVCLRYLTLTTVTELTKNCRRLPASNEWAERRAMFIRRSSLIVGCVLVCSLAASAAEVSSGDKVARLLSQKKYQQAEQLLLETIKKNPKSSSSYERLAQLYGDEQRIGDAIAIMEKRMPLPPRSTAAAVELATLYEEHGDHEKSLDVIKAIPVASRPARLQPIMAANYFALSRAAEAQATVGEILRLAPKNPELVPQLAKSLLKMGSVGDARGLLSVAQEHQKVTPSFLSALAQVQARTGKIDEARASVDQALALDPKHADALIAKSHLDGAAGNWKASMESLEKILANGPPRVDVLKSIVFASMQIDDLQMAHDRALELYELDPRSSESALALVAVLVRGSHWGEAGPILDKVLAENPTDKRAHLAKGIVEYNLGNMTSASEHLRASLGQSAADAEAHYMLGMVAKQAGDIPKAAEEMEASLAGNPNKMEALSSLGQFYLQLGDAEKAKTVLERAIQKGSADSQNHYQLAQAYRKLGMNDQAREQMDIFRKLSARTVPQPSGETPVAPK